MRRDEVVATDGERERERLIFVHRAKINSGSDGVGDGEAKGEKGARLAPFQRRGAEGVRG